MKLLSSDFDGTLFFMKEKSGYKKEDLEAISRFRKNGNKFGICTGRSLTDLKLHLNIEVDYMICTSGAEIYDKDENLIYQKLISNKTGQAILKQFDDIFMLVSYGVELLATKEHDFDINIPFMKEYSLYKEPFSCFSMFLNSPQHVVDSLTYLQQFDDIETFVNGNHIDVVAKGCSKGNGIHFIENYFGMSHENSGCIGDAANDIPMLTYCDTSFTFTYSPKEVQDKASHIVNQLYEAIEIMEK